ncbi:MAG: 6-bladed beta-propeller, partial [Balneola sp.]
MKKNTVLFFSFILISCSQNVEIDSFFTKKSSENVNLELKKVNTIILENSKKGSIGAPLYNVEFDASENMYFFDTIESKFIVFDIKGKLIKTFGREGRGPLEFELVYGYTLDEKNNLYVYDDALKNIKVINDSLKLTSLLKIDNKKYYLTSHDIEVVEGNLYMGILGIEAASTTTNSQKLIDSPLIMIHNTEDQLGENGYNYIGTYDPYLMEIESYYYRPIFSIDRTKETILVSHQNSYRFQEFDLKSGKLIKYFGYRSDNYGEGEKKTSRNKNRKENFINTLSESNNESIFKTDQYLGNFFLNGTEQWFDSKDLSDLNYFISI